MSPNCQSAVLCYATPYSIAFASKQEAEAYRLTEVEIVKSGIRLTPNLPSVEAFIYEPTNALSYPLVAEISLLINKRYYTTGRLNPDVCKTTAELQRFLKWMLTSQRANEVFSNNSCVRVSKIKTNEVLTKDLSTMQCIQNGQLMSVNLYAQEHVADGEHDAGSDELDKNTVYIAVGTCIGTLIFVEALIIAQRYFIQLAEIRGDVWKIKEIDLIPPESGHAESFTTLMPQNSMRQSYSQSSLIRRQATPNSAMSESNAIDFKAITGIYRSIGVTLRPTQIPTSTLFDYPTRRTLLELRKISHPNILRFYGLADLTGKIECQGGFNHHANAGAVNDELRFSPDEDYTDWPNFARSDGCTTNYFAVMEHYNEESIFYFLHCSTMAFPSEAKLPIIVQLINAVDYLHGRGIVHGKLNSQCCYFDQNFDIKIGDWECLEILEKHRHLRCSEIYLPSRILGFLRKSNVLRSSLNTKQRSMDCSNMNAVMRLRWRSPECLWQEIPLAKDVLTQGKDPPQESFESDREEDTIDEDSEGSMKGEISLSHFQDPAVDIYSLGVIINEIWSREIPFSGRDPEFDGEFQLLEAVSQGEVALEISSDLPDNVRLEILDNSTYSFLHSS